MTIVRVEPLCVLLLFTLLATARPRVWLSDVQEFSRFYAARKAQGWPHGQNCNP